MKGLIFGVASLLLVTTMTLMGGTLVSIPAVTDNHLELYQQVVRERGLQIPYHALIAVDAVRFRQDFSQVDRGTVEETADLFALCVPFQAVEFRFIWTTPQTIGYGFMAPREGTVNLEILDVEPHEAQVSIVGDMNRNYQSGAVLPPGEYHLLVSTRPAGKGFRVRVSMELRPCGPQEVAKVMDDLGLVGDDRQMALHMMAMHLPAGRFYPILDPNGPYVWPLAGNWPITSPYGPRLDPQHGHWSDHTGIDIGADLGTPVHSAAGGFVIHAAWDGGYGNVVRIDHGNGHVTVYAHLEHYLVAAGQQVQRGEAIGLVGSTGRSTGPHLHFEWRVDGAPQDPLLMYREEA